MSNAEEYKACTPVPVNPDFFNPTCELPYGLTVEHIRRAMEDFIDFLGFINQQLYAKGMPRIESFLMPANFSSIVGEFINNRIPEYCPYLVKNRYHNGHPDLIPKGMFPGDAVQHAHDGIEVKASRYAQGWQGHNPESVWLMVFHFDSNTAGDSMRGSTPKPFCFKGVYAARLDQDDWAFSGRSGASRRTITASVTQSGTRKMKANWIYKNSTELER
ncbi:hypothetical protein [Chloroflexus aurantiacus]